MLCPFITNVNNIIAFTHYLSVFIKALSTDSLQNNYEQKNYENISNFVAPVAEDNKSQVNIYTTVNGDVSLILNIDSTEANAIQNKSRKLIENMKKPVSGKYTNVVLHWFQTRNDINSQVGYKGTIEEISFNPIKVIMEQKVKEQIITSDDNFYKFAYLIDVKVSTINNKPILYEILTLRDTFEKDY